jgi:hypothetical protein
MFGLDFEFQPQQASRSKLGNFYLDFRSNLVGRPVHQSATHQQEPAICPGVASELRELRELSFVPLQGPDDLTHADKKLPSLRDSFFALHGRREDFGMPLINRRTGRSGFAFSALNS